WPVHFSLISQPLKAEGTQIEPRVVRTDAHGFARSNLLLGSQQGDYVVSARIRNLSGESDEVFFDAHARRSNWVFMLVIGLFGGLTLFLYGMNIMSEGLKQSAGHKMRSILKKLTKNRIIGVMVGAFITVVVQSSSATTVMLVSFVQARLMTFVQTLGVILGADIGTTVTAQLIAFRLTDVALLIMAVGFLMRYVSKVDRVRSTGDFLLGFGMLFFGMYIMSEAMSPLRNYTPFTNMLTSLETPLIGVLIGTAFTAIIQSSAAFVGIVMVLAQQNLIPLEVGISLLLGANIGTCITAVLASLATGREAKRVALAHTLFKVVGVLIFIGWIPTFAKFISSLTDSLPRQIAHAHTVFNVGMTILFLPFLDWMAKLVYKLLPDRPEREVVSPYKIKHLEDSLISTPSLALSLAKVEVLRMGGKVQKMVKDIIEPFLNGRMSMLDNIHEQEEEVDFLHEAIMKYLTKISRQSVAKERVDEAFQMLHTVVELEHIGDLVDKDMRPLARKKEVLGCEFSEEGRAEIVEFHVKVMKQLSRAMDVFRDVNLDKAERMKYKERKYQYMEAEYRQSHFQRVSKQVPESIASGEIHLELMDYLKQINSYATSIARILLVEKDETKPPGEKEKKKTPSEK
ncbi:Na/Pi cotransporter family protein, partial [bacterium]|nr:Na/Pi cotransporter family protein [bacterium]